MFTGFGNSHGYLTDDQVESVVCQGLDVLPLAGQRVLVLLPDRTRTFPTAMFTRILQRCLRGKARAVDFIVALGTHPPMDAAALSQLGDFPPEARVFNHQWNDPDQLVEVGVIPAREVASLSGGWLEEDLPVRLNKAILDYDALLVCGPVFPHEVVGFSGGNKYFFPGIAGPDVINLTHWLGALLTTPEVIGHAKTPVRALIDRAARLIPRPRFALCAVTSAMGVNGVYLGRPEEAFASAAELSAKIHIRYLREPVQQVLSILPEMYDDLWVGAKGMYKVEPAVADGGEIIIYAPHINEISRVHGDLIRQVGYHVRDYFLAQWDRFDDVPRVVLAHSTYLRGPGSYEDGVEQPRVRVTLATGIPEEECWAVNLGYRDPASIDPDEWLTRYFLERKPQDDDLLVVPHAGESLYRIS